MPLRYVNPAPRTRANASMWGTTGWKNRQAEHVALKIDERRRRELLAASGRRRARLKKPRLRHRHSQMTSGRGTMRSPWRPNPMKNWGAYGARSRAKKAHPARRRKNTMRKLFGAAAKAHARKLARTKRRPRRRRRARAANAAPRRRRRRRARASAPRTVRRRRRRNPAYGAAFGAVGKYRAPRKRRRGRKGRKRSRSRSTAPRRRRRRRHGGGRRSTAKSLRRARRSIRNRYQTRGARGVRRRYRLRSNPSRGRRRRRRRNGRWSTRRSMLRARRTVRNKYRTASGRAYARRYRMRSNPSTGMFVDIIKGALPVAGALYASRAISFGLASRIPLLNRVPARFQGTVMAALLGIGGFFATKKIGFLARHRGPIMLGLGLNFVDNLLSAVAPVSIKSRIGLGDSYDGLGDYLQVGGVPINDTSVSMGDYVNVGDYVEVGALEQELGVEEELGALEQELGGDGWLGGVRNSSMLAPVADVRSVSAVPDRSFTSVVGRAGAGFDNPSRLYDGIFAGGYGG